MAKVSGKPTLPTTAPTQTAERAPAFGRATPAATPAPVDRLEQTRTRSGPALPGELRALAKNLEADGNLDYDDADKIHELVTRDGAVSTQEREVLFDLLKDPKVDSGARSVLTQLAPTLTPKAALAAAAASPGWASLAPEVKERLTAVLGGASNTLSAAAREKLGELTSNPGWTRATAQDQATALTGLMNLGLGGASRLAAPPLPDASGYQTVSQTEVALHAYPNGENLPATQTRLLINGDTVDVFTPPAGSMPAGTWTPSLDEIARSLSAVPKEVLARTTSVTVSPSPHPMGPGATMAANGTGEMYSYPQPAANTVWNEHILTATVLHESGHNLSLTKWGTDPSSPDWQRWAAAEKSDGTSASSYANTNAFEDFAETFVLYLTTRGTKAGDELRKIFPGRWQLMDGLLVS
jgi:hypothetical protein